jgi:hypothetical protein
MWLRRAAGGFLAVTFLVFALMAGLARLAPAHHGLVPDALEEQWRPDLAQVRSVDAAMRILPSYVERQHGSREAKIAAGIDQFVRDRFFHDTSLLSWRENWLAVAAGEYWINLRVPVQPDAILHHRRAICSQQAIVFMEMLRRAGLHYAAVGMRWPSSDPASTGHFAVAAKVDGRWMYFDSDQEPPVESVPFDSLRDGSALKRLYGSKPALLEGMRYAAAHGQIRLLHVDGFAAPRGGLFQDVTAWLSAWGWAVLALLALACLAPELRPRRTGLQRWEPVPAE